LALSRLALGFEQVRDVGIHPHRPSATSPVADSILTTGVTLQRRFAPGESQELHQFPGKL
jgi:hypothetical protein